MLNNITSILKNNANLEPLFHKLEIKEKWEQILILNDKNKNSGDLYDVKYKIYSYYNLEGKIIKTLSKPIEKKFIKKLEKTDMMENFRNLVMML